MLIRLRWLASVLLLLLVAAPAQAQLVPNDDVLPPSFTEEASADAVAAYQRGDFATAIAHLEQALSGGADEPGLHVMLASALLQNGQPGRALVATTVALDRHPDHTALRLVHGEALMHANEHEKALRVFDAIHDDVETARVVLPEGIDREHFQLRLGLLHQWIGGQRLEADEPETALTHFKTARGHLPDSVSAHQNVAYTLAKMERWTEMERETKTALDRFPTAIPLLRLRAQALANLNRPASDILSTLQPLYEAGPGAIDVGLAYGRTLLATQKVEQAETVFNDLLARHPRDRRLYDSLVKIHKQRSHIPAAIEVRAQEQRQFPDDRSVPRDIGQLYEQIGAFDEARAVYDSLYALGGDDARIDAIAVARTYERQDSLTIAAAAYQTLATEDPTDTDLLRRLGSVQDRLGRWSDALDTYRTFADHASDEADRAYALARQGRALEQLGRDPDALSAYDEALALSPDEPLPYHRSAVLRYARDGADAAYPHAERALQKGLWAVADLQVEVTNRVKQDASTPWTIAPDAGAKRRQIEDLNDRVAAIFDFYGTHFLQARTEPVIQDLVQRYPDSGRLLYLVGRYYAAHDDSAAALPYYRQAVRHAPALRAAHLALGAAHEEKGQTRPAIQAYERALALDETAPDAYRALIGLYREAGRLDAVIARWQSRHRATPENAVLRAHLLEALHKAGRYEDARRLATASGEE